MHLTLKHKIIISSLLMLVLMTVICMTGYSMAKTLASSQDEGAEAAQMALKAEAVAGTGPELYQIVADAVINRNLEETEKDWAAGKAEALKNIADLTAKIADEEEKKLLATGNENLQAFFKIFEESTLPELKRIDSLSITQSIRENDDKMDNLREVAGDAFKKLAEKNLKETEDMDASFDATSQHDIRLMLGILIVGVVASIGNTLYLTNQISKPVKAMTAAMKLLSEGKFETQIPGVGKQDEIGSMADAVQIFRDNMVEAKRLAAEQEEMKKQAEIERRKQRNQMSDNLERAVGGIVSTVASASTELYQTSESLGVVATEANVKSTNVAVASAESSSNVQNVAAAIEEMSASIKEIGVQIHNTKNVVDSAISVANEAGSATTQLATNAETISGVVDMIQNIASQINLLALNATIESARAGEAGKGFAVVASEVKNLATQTAKATEEISHQIGTMQEASSNVVSSLNRIQAEITKVNEATTSIASAVEEQTAVTSDISRSMGLVANSVAAVNDNIGSVQQSTQTVHESTGQVLDASKMLSKQSELLNKEVSDFLMNIRKEA